jgi:hypothetical protein
MRDGMYLELIEQETGDEIADVFYSDETEGMQITLYKPDLPLELVEAFIARAKAELPPVPPQVSVSSKQPPQHPLA